MTVNLRYYQEDALDELDDGWVRGHKCQVLRMGTGTGKSATAARAVRENTGGSLMMAHRGEIVSQLSLALAREGVRHRVIGPPALARLCMQSQIEDERLGTHYIDPGSRVGVGSVQSIALLKGEEAFMRQVSFAVGDEFHHYLRLNQFGKAIYRLRPDIRLLGPTATPARTDGMGLGLQADGFADHMVLGPDEAEMMAEGWLCQYRIYCPPTSFNREALHIGAKGEFVAHDVQTETSRSTIFGDTVRHHTTRTPGKRALVFSDSIANAMTTCQKFRDAGITAEVLSGKTEAGLRSRILKRFDRREVEVVCSVSLIDEGFDCPGVEVVHDCAATTSLIKFRQRFGRGWRPDGDKVFIYNDYVRNVEQHGLPEAYRRWSLNRRDRASKGTPSDVVPVRVCANTDTDQAWRPYVGHMPSVGQFDEVVLQHADGLESRGAAVDMAWHTARAWRPLTPCGATYEAVKPACPYCGFKPVPAQRNGPEFVDGDLHELDAETLARMRGDVARVDGSWFPVPPGASPAVIGALRKAHHARQLGQAGLREAMQLWGGWQTALQRSDSEGFRRFYHRFGIDVMTAWTLPAAEAAALEHKIRTQLVERGIIDAPVN